MCETCRKRFFEYNEWLPRYYRITNRLTAYIISRLGNVSSFTSVAKEVNLSVATVIRMFDLVSTTNVEMPQVISIDEFKGDTNDEKYQCIITDPVNKVILDILPMRHKYYLSQYFKGFDRTETQYNNKIKVLKRNAYGYRNFDRFRKGILHIFSSNKENIAKAA